MSRRVVVLAFVVVALVVSPIGVAVATPAGGAVVGNETADEPRPDGPHVAAVYPNPLAEEDAGEYVVLAFPEATNLTGWTLSDGETNVSLPNTTIEDRIAVTATPNVTTNLTTASIVGVNESVSLANGGDEVTLRDEERVVDEMAYEDAPEAERYNRTADGWTWEHLGATNFSAVRTGPATVRAFVLPDAPAVPIDVLESADRRILLGGYTFSSERAATALERAAERGVDVRILVDDAPVGGMTTRQAKLLNRLTSAGVAVEVIGGKRARYDYHHPKYAVVDDRALVMTENWKPSGTGGRSSRGWGAVVRGGETAPGLAEVFRADIGWRDTVSWSTYRANETFETEPAANGSYPTNFEPKEIEAQGVQLLTAPDNAERVLVDRIDRANESVEIVQASIGSRRQPLLEAAVRAAERGVDVRILLSSVWYSEEENSALADWLNRKAEAENLTLDAKVADPGDRFEKIHAKGVIIDREMAVVGSLNWNNNSADQNREVAVVLEGKEAGEYYGKIFEADWEGGDGGPGIGDNSPLPVGIVAAVVGVVALAVVVARRIEFE
ncbi:phospholipase D-like domain-containing protein [Halococcus saccharolyticus]|uniref:Phospholipase D/Transphosphatidylase n=1 Tax=Halococcus saccharolyticus DSM 5350 TaxID=1227455 RepID=M0MJN3_9EURY|nr:phospholipase D-like domain-containing protein [Halococcus saccharolyticus]EMA45881.1 phospholipase D/Transphosphatidylase [Halococcus saccharolyticus DSM 5350]